MLCGGVASIVLIAAVCGVRPDISTEMKAPMFGSVCPCRRASNRRLDCDARPVVVDAARCALAPGAGQNVARVSASCRLLLLPVFITVFWAVRGLAPTRPRLAGATGGLLARRWAPGC